MYNFPGMDARVRAGFDRELAHELQPSIHPRVRSVVELATEVPVIITDFAPVQDYIREDLRGPATVAAFEGLITRHYEVLIQLPRAVDSAWRAFICTVCACMIRTYNFVSLVRRLRRGIRGDDRPWNDLWLSPNASFPLLLTHEQLRSQRLPLEAFSLTGSLFERLWLVYRNVQGMEPPAYTPQNHFSSIEPPPASTQQPAQLPSLPASLPPAYTAAPSTSSTVPGPSQPPAASAAPINLPSPSPPPTELISMDTVEEGVTVTELMDIELEARPAAQSAKTTASKGKPRALPAEGPVAGPSTTMSAPPSPVTPSMGSAVPPSSGAFGGVHVPRAKKRTRLDDSDNDVEILDGPKEATTPRNKGASSRPAKGKVVAKLAQPAASAGASSSTDGGEVTTRPFAVGAVPSGVSPADALRVVPGRPWDALVGGEISPPCGRCAINGASGRSSRGKDLPGSCVSPGPGLPCTHCVRDGQKCMFTLDTEDRRVVDNNLYFIGTMSPAAFIEGAERVGRQAQLYAALEQTVFALGMECLAEQRKFLSNLRRAEHLRGKPAMIEQIFGSEELYQEYQLHYAYAFDPERERTLRPSSDVNDFAHRFMLATIAHIYASGQRGKEEATMEAHIQQEVERRLAARLPVETALAAVQPQAGPSTRPPPESAASASRAFGFTNFGGASTARPALVAYGDSPEASDEDMDSTN
ncbi:hypothetical protein BKA70DRAFT_1423454 [Coprinopsis sp. MPI-PUGE-AT-0042]|nr:hypothetical protein BKA70DRAFT_1423454 [Coprinopsis sp. MPI-PUGE-AT-0042]